MTGAAAKLGWRDLADSRVALMLAFGYSAGLPFLLVFGTLSIWLRESGVALVTYMSGLTAPGFVATQYALLSSLYALPGKFVGGVSGFIVTAYGYPAFFAMTAAVGIPVVLLCLWVTRPVSPGTGTPPASRTG